MEKTQNLSEYEAEAVKLLQHWVNEVNSYFKTPFQRSKQDEVLGVVESMLTIYNIFATTKCKVDPSEITAAYELVYF